MYFTADVAGDSISEEGARLTTFVVTFPSEGLALLRFPRAVNCSMQEVARQTSLPSLRLSTMVLTATEWDEFFVSQAAKGVSLFHFLVGRMREAYETSAPILKKEGEWHLPFVEHDAHFSHPSVAIRVSAVRCAFGVKSGAGTLAYDELIQEDNLGPLGHVATPFGKRERSVRDALAMAMDELPARLGKTAEEEVQRVLHSLNFQDGYRGWTSHAYQVREGE